jgi:hypothetical protein
MLAGLENEMSLERSNKIKKDLFRYLDLNVIVDKFLNNIEKSENFSFISERSKKHINRIKPSFHIIVKVNSLLDNDIKLLKSIEEKENKVIDYFYDEVSSIILDEMSQAIIENDPKNNPLLKSKIFGWNEDDLDYAEGIISTVLIFNTSFNEKNIESKISMFV